MTALLLTECDHTSMIMGNKTEDCYRKALELLNVKEVSRETGRAWRTLMAYKRQERRVTTSPARELIQFLRSQSSRFTAAADALAPARGRRGVNNPVKSGEAEPFRGAPSDCSYFHSLHLYGLPASALEL